MPKTRAAQRPGFQNGDQVRHNRFGTGKVVEVQGENLLIRFAQTGVKRVRPTYLSVA